MPPRWPRQPDRADPEFRRLDDRMNFATHVAVFSATNSGLWFVETLLHRADTWAPWVTLGWLGVLAAHTLYVFAIANYSTEA